jgi:voltage-gated potassium channel
VLVLAAAAIYNVERDADGANIHSFADALWWAATTVTTVGYGDRYPTTGAGRLIATTLMVVGIALIGVVTATIAAWFVDRLRDVEQAEVRAETTMADVLTELRRLHARLDRLDVGERKHRPAE